MMRTRQGSYFYVIDAFIASIIILTTLFVLFSRFMVHQQPTQALYTAEDVLTTMETTTASSYNDDQIQEWVINGNITNMQYTIIEQLAEFNYSDRIYNRDNAKKLAEIVGKTVPEQVGVSISLSSSTYGSSVLYTRSPRPMQEADTVLTAKRIVLLKQSSSELLPPYIIEVSTWQ